MSPCQMPIAVAKATDAIHIVWGVIQVCIRMRLAVGVPPTPHLVARRLSQLAPFCDGHIADQSFESRLYLHVLATIRTHDSINNNYIFVSIYLSIHVYIYI